MNTEAFLRCFKRFTSKRGFPVRILTDNAKTFKAAEKWLLKVMRHPTVKVYLQESGVSWQFNVERAPWWGGVFKRMVQIAKRLLRKVVGTARLTFDELSTAIVEVEALVNSRPLTYISSSDLIKPLTPSHLLSGRRISVMPEESEEEDTYDPTMESGAGTLTRRMKHLANTIEHMWNRWRSEYLLELRNSHRSRNRRADSTSNPQVAVGDMVIIEDSVPRGFWKLAVVTELLTDRDGEIRAAAIGTHTKDGKLVRFTRPLQKLYPLEVQETALDSQSPQPEQLREVVTRIEPDMEETKITKTKEQRPQRKAAVRAQEKITPGNSQKSQRVEDTWTQLSSTIHSLQLSLSYIILLVRPTGGVCCE